MENNPVQPNVDSAPQAAPPAAPAAVQPAGYISVQAWADEEQTVMVDLGVIGGERQFLSVTYDPNLINEDSRRAVMLHINDEDSPVAPAEISSWIKRWGLQGPLKVRRWVPVLDKDGKDTGKQQRIAAVVENVLQDDGTYALPCNAETMSTIRTAWMSRIMTAIFENTRGEME